MIIISLVREVSIPFIVVVSLLCNSGTHHPSQDEGLDLLRIKYHVSGVMQERVHRPGQGPEAFAG
jgi:hypothetical protein